jgi:mono/diheme cytochrome c family protein
VKAKFLLISVAIIGVFWTAKSLYEGNRANKVDYSTQVKPILNKHCITCHGGVKKIGGFSLLFRTDALAKTKSGKPAIVPFHPEQSDFIARLTHNDLDERMPYKANPLKKEEIDLLTRWVKEGSEWGDHCAESRRLFCFIFTFRKFMGKK